MARDTSCLQAIRVYVWGLRFGAIGTEALLAGGLPPRARRLVVEWAQAHGDELRENWSRARQNAPYSRSSRCAERSTILLMRSTPKLAEAQAIGEYVVHVRFEDGTSGDIDLAYLLDYGGVFEPLRDFSYFAQLVADQEAGTIVWPNGADIAPETLYAHAQRHAAATA
jgi:hypothetical protein